MPTIRRGMPIQIELSKKKSKFQLTCGGVEMNVRTSMQRALAAALMLMLTACGSGSLHGEGDTGGGTDGGGSGGEPAYRMGAIDGSGFTPSVLFIPVTTLSAGGSTQVVAHIVDQNGAPYNESVDVFFRSSCTAMGAAEMASPVQAVGGRAETVFVAKGCETTDTISATATVGGAVLTASGNVTVQGAEVGSLEFVSATPEIIALKGTSGGGRPETSSVVFRVLNSVGGPAANTAVTFALNTDAGGLAISPTRATSGSDGLVQTIVTSGSVITSVRVTATVEGSGISTQSSALKVSAGLPDQNSMSISAETLNPEAWNIDGVRVPITVRLADHFNNRVPDGTAVSFTTEGGSIDGATNSCQTTGGACTVEWVSQNPRPEGRITILATALGEESFTDQDGDHRFDSGEPFTDMSEAFLDENENTIFDAGIEPYLDFNSNGSFDSGDGAYNGNLCAADNTACSGAPKSIHIRDSIVLVMSGSSAQVLNYSGLSGDPVDPVLVLSSGVTSAVRFTIADQNGNVLPKGTTIKASSSLGTVESPSSYTVPNTSGGPGTYRFDVTGEEQLVAPKSGRLTIEVTTPSGLTTYFFYRVTQSP